MYTNKIIFLSILFCLLISNPAFSQEKAGLNWQMNYDSILLQAANEKKPVLIYFHGSDWCPGCIYMTKEVMTSPVFVDYVSDKVLFLDIDFPYHTKLSTEQLAHNTKIKMLFNLPEAFTQGFPQVVIVNEVGEVLYQEQGYRGEGPEKLVGIIKSIISNK